MNLFCINVFIFLDNRCNCKYSDRNSLWTIWIA